MHIRKLLRFILPISIIVLGIWFLLLAYHTGSLLFSFVLLAIIRRSRYRDQLRGDPQDLAAKESPKAQMLRRAYGSTVYMAQLGFWYLSFGT